MLIISPDGNNASKYALPTEIPFNSEKKSSKTKILSSVLFHLISLIFPENLTLNSFTEPTLTVVDFVEENPSSSFVIVIIVLSLYFFPE
ncbi:hypothetical protein D3C76_949850 [compost metagenome]